MKSKAARHSVEVVAKTPKSDNGKTETMLQIAAVDRPTEEALER